MKKDGWIPIVQRSFNNPKKGSLDSVRIPIVQRSAVVQRSFNDRKKGSFQTIVERSKQKDDRSTIVLKPIVQRSFNNREKGSLKTIVQRSQEMIVSFQSFNDHSTIVKKDS